MSHLVRARQSQEDTASRRLAFARRAQARAHDRARIEADRVDELTRRLAAADAGAFVAAAAAAQAAAATHSVAVGEVAQADAWVVERQRELTEAAVARQVAEELRDRAETQERVARAEAAQRELDEIATARHQRLHGSRS